MIGCFMEITTYDQFLRGQTGEVVAVRLLLRQPPQEVSRQDTRGLQATSSCVILSSRSDLSSSKHLPTPYNTHCLPSSASQLTDPPSPPYKTSPASPSPTSPALPPHTTDPSPTTPRPSPSPPSPPPPPSHNTYPTYTPRDNSPPS